MKSLNHQLLNYISRHNALRKPVTGTEVKEDIKSGVIGWKTDLDNESEEKKANKAKDDNKDIFNQKLEKNTEEVEVQDS